MPANGFVAAMCEWIAYGNGYRLGLSGESLPETVNKIRRIREIRSWERSEVGPPAFFRILRISRTGFVVGGEPNIE